MKRTNLKVVLIFEIFVLLLFNSCFQKEDTYYNIDNEYTYKLSDKSYLVYKNQEAQTDTFVVEYYKQNFIYSGETEGNHRIYSEIETIILDNSTDLNDSTNLFFEISRSANYIIFDREFSSVIDISGHWVLNSNQYIEFYADYQVADKSYENVFYYYDPDISPSLDLINKIYYSHQYGIIQYVKSNGETWELITK